MGKSSINGQFSIAMLNNQRVPTESCGWKTAHFLSERRGWTGLNDQKEKTKRDETSIHTGGLRYTYTYTLWPSGDQTLKINSLLVNVDIPINTKRLVRISRYPCKIDLVNPNHL